MSVQDYMSASKIGKRAYHACVNKGRYPYLPVLENIVDESDIEAEVSLGIDQIPLRLVVGTCNAGRTNAFADNCNRGTGACHNRHKHFGQKLHI